MGALAEARALGFLGPGPLEHHVESAERFAAALDEVSSRGPALDLGSGGGVPGLLLAEWFPHWNWTLFDANRRRTSFLAVAVARCGFAARVTVVRGRAEDAGHDPVHRERYRVVTARSFGPPAATAEAATGFVAMGGTIVVAEPPGEPPRWDAPGLSALSLRVAARMRGVVVLEKTSLAGAAFPRPLNRQRDQPAF